MDVPNTSLNYISVHAREPELPGLGEVFGAELEGRLSTRLLMYMAADAGCSLPGDRLDFNDARSRLRRLRSAATMAARLNLDVGLGVLRTVAGCPSVETAK